MLPSTSVRIRTLVATSLALPLILGACGGGGPSSPGESGEGTADSQGTDNDLTIGVAMYALDDPLFLGIRNGGLAAAADYGVNVNFQSADNSLSNQISIIQNFISQDVDAILVDPIDAQGILPAIAQAEAAGVPLITLGNKVDSDHAYAMTYPDYENMAAAAGVMGTWLDQEGQVALIVGAPGNYVSDTRQAGFLEAIESEFPEIEVVAVEATGYDPAQSQRVTQTLLRQYPELKGIAAITDPLAEASIAEAQNQGRDGLVWTGYNGDANMEPYLKDGRLLVDALTGSTRIGYWFVAGAARIAAGEELDREMVIETYLASSEETIAELGEKGYEGDLIPVGDQAAIRESYSEDFGPDATAEAFNAADDE